jgi:hypothetical protein
MEAGISDWVALWKLAYKHTKPDRFIEIIEFDIAIRSQTVAIDENHIFKRWVDLVFESGEKLGKTFKKTLATMAFPISLQRLDCGFYREKNGTF